ncbi:MAG: outer membrane lipoprotein-sorting protein [Acidobacteriota bacterium]|nr:outer membrane lipoprotein-sorting protein [Acidobacteriota bacterium]
MIQLKRIAASLLLLSSASLLAQPKPGHLDEVLRQMDASSLKFQSAEATFQWNLYEQVVHQVTTEQGGTIFFKKAGNKTLMGAKMTTPSVKLIDYRDALLRLYDVATDHLTTVRSKDNQMESFLTLGFGGSGKDLARAWTISDLGTETVDGVETARMDLVSKDPEVRKNISHVTVWVDPARDISLKQVFYLSSEDYRTALYTAIRYNQHIDEKPYAIKTTGKTTRDEH